MGNENFNGPALRDVLADTFLHTQEIEQICRDADLALRNIDFYGSSSKVWTSVLARAREEGDEKKRALLKRCLHEAPILGESSAFQSAYKPLLLPSLESSEVARRLESCLQTVRTHPDRQRQCLMDFFSELSSQAVGEETLEPYRVRLHEAVTALFPLHTLPLSVPHERLLRSVSSLRDPCAKALLEWILRCEWVGSSQAWRLAFFLLLSLHPASVGPYLKHRSVEDDPGLIALRPLLLSLSHVEHRTLTKSLQAALPGGERQADFVVTEGCLCRYHGRGKLPGLEGERLALGSSPLRLKVTLPVAESDPVGSTSQGEIRIASSSADEPLVRLTYSLVYLRSSREVRAMLQR